GLQGLTAVILVGGPGTRLQPLTNDRPKSVLPVLNKPFMEHFIAYLRQYGIEDIILTLSYLPDVIREYLGDGSRYGVRLTYCLEEEPLGTAGAVKNAEAYLDNTFFVLNGDVFTDMDLGDMLAFHRENKAKATISLTWVDDPSAFGVVETDGEKRVKQFIEKPPLAEATTNWINAGTYILEPEVLEHIPSNTHYMFEKGLYPRLLDTGAPVYGYPYRGYWLDMGTPEKYFSLNVDLLSSKINSPLVSIAEQNGICYSRDAVVHPSVVVTAPVVIDSGSRVGRGVHIRGPVVIGRDCHLEDGASIENAVLWNNVNIGAGARLSQCIISSDINISSNQDVVNCIVTPSQTVPLFPT
ncbi:MAG: NDP-sugar synthase, partial [Dehalococcoidales bacterium]|nr:NDP-sugar synthase [Dehalococcoidales bacterium]